MLIGLGIGVAEAVGGGVSVKVGGAGIKVFVALFMTFGISGDGTDVISGAATSGAHALIRRAILIKTNKVFFITEFLTH